MMNGDDAKEELWLSLLTRRPNHDDDLCTQWKLRWVSFSFFLSFLSLLFLKEEVIARRWCAVLGGFEDEISKKKMHRVLSTRVKFLTVTCIFVPVMENRIFGWIKVYIFLGIFFDNNRDSCRLVIKETINISLTISCARLKALLVVKIYWRQLQSRKHIKIIGRKFSIRCLARRSRSPKKTGNHEAKRQWWFCDCKR